MRRLTVAVAHHREVLPPVVDVPPYEHVCNVRPDGSRPAGFSTYDDDGGLPERNAAYNELSALHWLWQRADTEHVGLAHYRRVLVAAPPRGAVRGEQRGTFHVPVPAWQDPGSWAADETSLLPHLARHDWLVPRPYDVRSAGARSLWEHFVTNHPEEPLRRADRAVRLLHPDLEPLEPHLRSVTTTPLFNIFLGRREVLQEYAAFLFPVLAACEQDLALSGYQGRWAGFLAERLHGYWLHAARSRGLRVGVLPLALLGMPHPPLPRRVVGALPPALGCALLNAARTGRRTSRS